MLRIAWSGTVVLRGSVLIECLIWIGNFFSFLDLSLLQEVRQVRFLSVPDFKVVLDHGGS
jgi:hypothetical protein